MNNDITILNSLKEFTEEMTGRKFPYFSEKDLLEKNLGLYGTDAVEFIIAFGKKYNVDVSNFMAKKYFSPEGISFLKILHKLIINKKDDNRQEIAVYDLIQAIKIGKLDETTIKYSK